MISPIVKDLRNPVAIWGKALLFLGLGLSAAALIILQNPSLRIAVLLAIVIWAFCRAYYFAFYVIEHYLDPGYRFSGLGSFLAYLYRRRRGGQS